MFLAEDEIIKKFNDLTGFAKRDGVNIPLLVLGNIFFGQVDDREQCALLKEYVETYLMTHVAYCDRVMALKKNQRLIVKFACRIRNWLFDLLDAVRLRLVNQA